MKRLRSVRTWIVVIFILLFSLTAVSLSASETRNLEEGAQEMPIEEAAYADNNTNTTLNETMNITINETMNITVNETNSTDTNNITINETNETTEPDDGSTDQITGDVIKEETEPAPPKERTDITAIYIYGATGMDIAEVNGERRYYHKDALGSVRAVTDNNGLVLETSSYMPFGENLDENSEQFTFSSKEQDDTGLQYFGARFYDPALGRFLSTDPARDGPNLYSYVSNNPINKMDPSGLTEQDTDEKPTARVFHGFGGPANENGAYTGDGVDNFADGAEHTFDVVAEVQGIYNEKSTFANIGKVLSYPKVRAELARLDLPSAEWDLCYSGGGWSSLLAGGSSKTVVYQGIGGNQDPFSTFKIISLNVAGDYGVSTVANFALDLLGLGGPGGFIMRLTFDNHMGVFKDEGTTGQAFKGFKEQVENTPVMLYYRVEVDKPQAWDWNGEDGAPQLRRSIGLSTNPHYNPAEEPK